MLKVLYSPGLIDTHIHGFNGHGTDNCSPEAMLSKSEDLAIWVRLTQPYIHRAKIYTNNTIYQKPWGKRCKNNGHSP